MIRDTEKYSTEESFPEEFEMMHSRPVSKFTLMLFVISACFLFVTFYSNGTFDFSPPSADVKKVYAIQNAKIDADLFLANVQDDKMPLFIRNKLYAGEEDAKPVTVVNTSRDTSRDERNSLPENSEGAHEILAYFEQDPDTSVAGDADLVIILEDMGGNKAEYNAEMTVFPGRISVDAEAGSSPSAITMDSYVKIPAGINSKFVGSLEEYDFNKAGTVYNLPISIEECIINCEVRIVDTTPPTGTAVSVAICTMDTLVPDAFVSDIQDVSEVTCEFVQPPDYETIGKQQDVTIKLTDISGNTAMVNAELTIVQDTKKPVIKGTKNIAVLKEGKPRYREGVTVSDDFDNDIELEIDSSAVNISVPGRYPVHYSAVDDSGNETVITITVSVLGTDEMTVYDKADEILRNITNENMSDTEKAWAIFNWEGSHVRYTSTANKSSVLQGAYDAFFTGRGDCYTFYAAGEVLLTRAGIDNIAITRIPGARHRHFWSIVNTGNGWYHYDACPVVVHFNRFMFTESQAQNYTKMLASHEQNYYDYEHEKYPEVVW